MAAGPAPRPQRPPQRGRGRGRPHRSGNSRGGRRGRRRENWWARRWVEVLERFAVGRRLGRGRNYARQGHIVDIEIGKGFVTAHVQGSRDAPYLVRMHFSMLSSTDWKKLTRALAQRPDIAVELGMGQIPESIEQVFEEQRLSLFPNASGDLKAACSCPDNANPCKHVAAVYYLLGEEFDRDPFLIFQLRGMERSELLAALGPAAIPRPPAPPPPPPEPIYGEDGERLDEGEAFAPPPIAVIEPPPERVIPDEPLPEDPGVFWGGAVRSRDEAIEVRIPRKPGAIVARLGGFPFWRGQSNCEAAMARTYRNASITGLDVYLGAGAVNEDDEELLMAIGPPPLDRPAEPPRHAALPPAARPRRGARRGRRGSRRLRRAGRRRRARLGRRARRSTPPACTRRSRCACGATASWC